MADTKVVQEVEDLSHLQHPNLRPAMQRRVRDDGKSRRTIVRVAKLINDTHGGGHLIQVPIEPSHNNHGVLDDPSMPLRHYLNKGFQFPHEADPSKYNFMFCAVIDCWDKATLSDRDAPVKTERCADHEEMWQGGLIRYATGHRGRSR